MKKEKTLKDIALEAVRDDRKKVDDFFVEQGKQAKEKKKAKQLALKKRDEILSAPVKKRDETVPKRKELKDGQAAGKKTLEKNPVPRRLGGAAGGGRVKEMARYGEIGLKGSYRFLNEGFLSQLPKVGASLPKAHNPPPKLRGRAQTPSAPARGPRARGGWR